jgi:hypothetical protein
MRQRMRAHAESAATMKVVEKEATGRRRPV